MVGMNLVHWHRVLLGVLVVSIATVAGPSEARASKAEVAQTFAASVRCSRDLSNVVRDIERTRDVKARGKRDTQVVVPGTIAGRVYLDRLLDTRGSGVLRRCKTAYDALRVSKAMRFIPARWKAPGSTVARGNSALSGARLVASSLKNTTRMRLSGVKQLISDLRRHANTFLSSVNGLEREASKLVDHEANKGVSSGKSQQFEALRYCASQMSMLSSEMWSYRMRAHRKKRSSDKIAPRNAVGAARIEAVMQKNGWLAKCHAQHAAMTRNPMKSHLPKDFLRPHYGDHARMKTALTAIRVNGAFLRGNRQQAMRTIDSMLSNLDRASRDFLNHTNRAYRHAGGR
ncbi:MAG: hypothetical protein AAF928_18015 [Myxococcota bacterium]